MGDEFFIDEEQAVLEHFFDAFEEGILDAERLALELEEKPDHREALSALAGILHQLYSVAVNSNIIPLIEPLSTINDFLRKLEQDLGYQSVVTVPLTLLFDRMMLMAKEAVTHSAIGFQHVRTLQAAITPLARVSSSDDLRGNLDEVVQRLLNTGSEAPVNLGDVELFDEVELFDAQVSPDLQGGDPASQGILVAYTLAELLEERISCWRGRSNVQLSLALQMNHFSGGRVDEVELIKAVLVHDFSMITLPEKLLYKRGMLVDGELECMRRQPLRTCTIVNNLHLGEECAQMVLEHHERPDGRGYPNGIDGEAIHDGARIIALCDAFFAMTHEQGYRPSRRTALRAAAEINACSGSQFDSFWIGCFNEALHMTRLFPSLETLQV